MAIHDLPDMYALSPRACGTRASDIHIRQIPHGHITTITYSTAATVRMVHAKIDIIYIAK